MNMRETINAANELPEMPARPSGSEDFGLDTATTNLRKAKYFDSPTAITLYKDDECRLAILGHTEGEIGLVAKQDRKLYYYVKYESMSLPMTGRSVTQVKLWRNRWVEEVFAGITRYVFFNVLLPRFQAIMSDTLQPIQGQQFWEPMVAVAKGLGLTIEMADFNTQTIQTYDKQQFPDIGDWLIHVNPWGCADSFEKRRLIIRRL
jgi:hypothetical protein